jgi:hypothetical protein
MRTKNNRIYKRVHRKSIVRKNKRKSIVRKKQYGGTPPPPFVDILTVNYGNDTSLLQMIYSNLDMFINALHDNNIPEKRLEGIETRWVSSVKSSNGKLLAYWKGVRLMECFKHPSFDYNNTINEIFLQTFFAEYNMGDEKYILKENITEHKLPFIFYRQLGPQGKVGTPYLITHQSTKTNIIMKISNHIHLNIDVVCAPKSDSTCSECIKRQTNTNCFPKTKTIEYIVKSSEFINETIIGYVLNTRFFPKHNESFTFGLDSIKNALNGELLEGELGNSVYQIGHFQSNDNYGSNIMEQADAELDKLFKGEKSLHTNEHFQKIKMVYNGEKYFGCNPEHKDIIITMLLLQLSNTLKIVADDFGMIHGDLKAGNVFFSIKDNYSTVNYPLNDTIKIKTNIRLKIADYGKSSIIYNGIRFYCDSLGSGVTNTAIEWAGDTDINVGDKYSTGFGLNIKGVSASIKLRHLPCPYFRSFDFYCVIVSLAIQSTMFMKFYTDNQINLVLFGYSENIPFEIPLNMNIESINTAIWILNQSKYNGRFKCNGIEECIEKCIIKLDEFKKPYKTELVDKIDDIIHKYQLLIDEDTQNDLTYTPLLKDTYENNLKEIEAITNMTKKLQDIPINCAYINLTIESIKFIIDDINKIYNGIHNIVDKAVKKYICHNIVTNLTTIKENITPFGY